MRIETKFSLGQTIYRCRVYRSLVDKSCPVCNGEGRVGIVGADGTKHFSSCPNSSYSWHDSDDVCRGGRVSIGQRHCFDPPYPLTVGQIRAEVTSGGIIESAMCVETGVGSGSVYYVDPPTPDPATRGNHWGVFATEAEAISWAESVVAYCNSRLKIELLHAEALALDAALVALAEGETP